MAMGFLNARRYFQLAGLVALALAGLQFRLSADDQVTKKDGTVVTGQVVGVAGGQVAVVSRVAAFEATAQCDTRRARLPA